MRKYHIVLTLISALLLSACTQSSAVREKEYKKVPCDVNRGIKSYYDIDVDYIKLSDDAIVSVFQTIDTVPQKVLVTDFVDLTSLNNFSRLGYVFSNSIKNSLIHKYNVNVIEAEVSKYFKISGNGLKILSRNVDNMRTQTFDVTRVVVGTYTYTDEEIVFFVKLINLESGIIEGSYAKKLPMTCEMMYLLSQR